MTALNDARHTATPAVSVFVGAEVARVAGFTLAAGARGPVFDDDVWDCTAVARLPAQLSRAGRCPGRRGNGRSARKCTSDAPRYSAESGHEGLRRLLGRFHPCSATYAGRPETAATLGNPVLNPC